MAACVGQRDATTVATQALFMLNSPFVREQSLYLADSLLASRHQSDAERIRRAYELVLSRDPSPQESKKIRTFLARYKDSYSKLHETADSNQPHLVNTSDPPSDITAGISRADDEGDPPKQTIERAIQPENPKQAAWASFVQSLYASAEFEFVR
jgi:hypothetical protein